jgi:tetrahydromethanopterin S-methyltransferase subunit G
MRRENAKQDIALSVTGQQYTEVIRRLDGIDRKLDKR